MSCLVLEVRSARSIECVSLAFEEKIKSFPMLSTTWEGDKMYEYHVHPGTKTTIKDKPV